VTLIIQPSRDTIIHEMQQASKAHVVVVVVESTFDVGNSHSVMADHASNLGGA
jgi:hypothetical protein